MLSHVAVRLIIIERYLLLVRSNYRQNIIRSAKGQGDGFNNEYIYDYERVFFARGDRTLSPVPLCAILFYPPHSPGGLLHRRRSHYILLSLSVYFGVGSDANVVEIMQFRFSLALINKRRARERDKYRSHAPSVRKSATLRQTRGEDCDLRHTRLV